MSNEITVTGSLNFNKNGSIVTGSVGPLIQTQSGNNGGSQVFTTSTSGALIPVGGATTFGGWLFVKNLDASITIGIYQDGASATVKICDLLPGAFALFPPAAAPGCKAASGTPDLLCMYVEP